jgi:predicted dienelactone hydrolase
MEALASHGFVVASPEHTGNAQGSMTDTWDQAAANRVPDVSFVIDTLFDRGRDSGDVFHGRLDESRTGVAGHSFGGMTAMGVAAGWAGAAADPRVTAIAPISAVIDTTLQPEGQGEPNAGFEPGQLARVEIPVLLLGGTEDVNVPIEQNNLAFDQLTGAPSVYQVDIVGANHTHFTNICDIGDLLLEIGIEKESWPSIGAQDLLEPYETTCEGDVFPIAEAIRLQNLYVVAFMKRHLLGIVDYQQYLTKKATGDEPAIRFRIRS